MKEKIISLKKGSVLIWAANLLHGGISINDHNRSRYSQVTHYNFENCKYYYHPVYSKPQEGKYYLRDINTLDLRNFYNRRLLQHIIYPFHLL